MRRAPHQVYHYLTEENDVDISMIAKATTEIENVALSYGSKMMLYAAIQYLIEQNELNPLSQHHLEHIRRYLLVYLWPDCPSAPALNCQSCGD